MTRMVLNLAWLRQPRWRRRMSALSAIAAAVAFIGIAPISSAYAEEVDQIVGSGDSPSALTVSWSQGLLGADNQTVVRPRDPQSAFAFMHDDFRNLTVTVSQTRNLVHQAITVKWSGGLPTAQPFKSNFLQLMQCHGDAFAGPNPEGCQFGSTGLLQGSVINPGIGARGGNLCETPEPSTTNPPATLAGSGAVNGCDPSEPRESGHIDPCPPPQICNPGRYNIPFVPAGTTDKFYGTVTEFYDQFNTNEVQQATTNADGTGEVSFQTLTSVQAPGLGCGLLKQGGTPRGCWLVIVPRGTYEPNGWKLTDSSTIAGFMNESPLGDATWSQRIQINLGFNNVPSSCAIGSAKERQLVGTELVSRAVFSWQVALNAAAQCRVIFGYAATPEPVNTIQLTSPEGVGLAFTTIPIGSEVARSGGTTGESPPLVYAPLAVSATTFGFYINQPTGLVTSRIKLTPRLLAKAVTQSYRFDLPDVDSNHAGPDWARNNPDFITRDPEFQRLNPGITTPASGLPRAPLVTGDRSAVNHQIWSWIVADPSARAWLGGEPDEHGMVINPNYKDLRLGDSAIDSYPRADPTCFHSSTAGARVPRCSLDLLPYMASLHNTATQIRAANNPQGAAWDPLKLAPDGQTGWWSNGGIEPAGQIFLWGVVNSADIAGLGLVPAELCSADGTSCVAPSTDSVARALASAKKDTTGLLSVDPAAADGGYPLVAVSYAAVRTTQNPEALRDYASLISYAVGPGQAPGVEPGQLPRGYLPLPEPLRAEAAAAAAQLSTLAGATATPGTSATIPVVPGPAAPPPPPPMSDPDRIAYTITRLTPAPEWFTPTTPLGAVRFVLLGVFVVGLLGAIGGPVLRSIGRWSVVRRLRKGPGS